MSSNDTDVNPMRLLEELTQQWWVWTCVAALWIGVGLIFCFGGFDEEADAGTTQLAGKKAGRKGPKKKQR